MISRTNASFSLTAPCVREKIPGFGGFFKSGDTAVTWNEGDEVVMRFTLYSFPANDIPVFLEKFMDARKTLTGENHPRNITPMSAIFKYTIWQTDNYRWYEDADYKLYSLDAMENFFGYRKVFQLGWVAGMMNTFPILLIVTACIRPVQRAQSILLWTECRAKAATSMVFIVMEGYKQN